ncbi:DUF1571 domain-containing protein [Paludisphaera rhizosphaerae]|uniref:DUF1571 domain-containing protein n=1 Tax=Paludisphaera rhizosphaerae TaxID=2711216 RepID=UPI0013E9EA51|nr:DUF1571 domain-containing protein [Paludisphaera rhizosphaerae]
MNPANNAASKTRSAGLAALTLAAALSTAGCATSGGELWHSGSSSLTNLLWPRERAEPGYDLYAQNMAGSKGVKQAESAAQAGADQENPSKPAATRSAAEVAADDRGAGAASAFAESKPRGVNDARVRVTLGRPESVPVLKDADGRPGPLIASTAPDIQGPLAQATDPAPAPGAAQRQGVAEAKPEPAPALAAADLAPEPAPAPAAPALAQAEPAAETQAAPPEANLKTILDGARERLEGMSTYQVAITRVERVGSQVLPEEKALLSIRRNPKAVRLEWPEGANKGREVIYSAAINDKVMHVNVANSAIPIPRMTLPVDSPLAMRNSRHAITEAGFDTIFNNLSKQVDSQGRPTGAEGRLTYKGLQQPEGGDRPCHLIQRITPAKEVWRVYLDEDTLMPVVVTAHQADGGLLESYRYENLKADPTELAAAEAFDPDKRWGPSQGLFSRIARAAAATAEQPAATTR